MSEVDSSINEIKLTCTPTFTIPLYIQRYNVVTKIIEKYKKCSNKLSKIADFGCSSFGFFQFLKQIKKVKEIVLIDISYEDVKDNIKRLNPCPGEVVDRQRRTPLAVTVLLADLRFKHAHLQNTDIVTMIEFIEHLIPSDLEHVVNRVFNDIQPDLVIVTTPNRDFNKYFPDLPTGKFRHADHKFEFSYSEFNSWCYEIVSKHPCYIVNFSGCGGPIGGSFCSQIATFLKDNSRQFCKRKKIKSPSADENYNSLSSALRPCQKNCTTKKLCNIFFELQYPFDDRSEKQRKVDTVKECWGVFRRYLLAEKEYMENICKENDMVIRFCNRNEKSSSFSSADLKMDELPDEEIFIKIVSDFKEIKNGIKENGNTLYFNVSDECYYVPYKTFVTWSKLKLKHSLINIALSEMNLEKIELNSQSVFLVRLHEEEDSDDYDCDDNEREEFSFV